MVVQFELMKEHGYLFLSILSMGLQCLLFGFFCVGRTRAKLFTKEFMEKNFKEQCKKTTGNTHKNQYKFLLQGSDDVKYFGMGYPDMGCGRFSEKLSFDDWMLFNKAQRVHYNYLEAITPMAIFSLLAGFACPCCATYLCLIFIIGRFLYAKFYMHQQGARHPLRIIGAVMCDIGLLGNFAIGVAGALKIAQII